MGLDVPLDAEGEVVHFEGELVFFFEGGFVGDVAFGFGIELRILHLDAVVGEGGVQLGEGFGAFDAEELRLVGVVSGVEGGGEAGGEAGDDLAGGFDFGEAGVVLGLEDVGLDFGGFFVREEAGGVEAVDADVGHAASAGEGSLEAPLGEVALVLGVGGDELLELAELA